MGLETGWSGITQPGIENRFMDSVVSQLQYPDAYRDAKRKEKKERKKKKKKKKKRYAYAPRGACASPRASTNVKQTARLCVWILSMRARSLPMRTGYVKMCTRTSQPYKVRLCRARDQWRPRASLFGKFCFHERDTNWIGGIRVGWFLEMKRTGKLVLVRDWNYLRNIYIFFFAFLGKRCLCTMYLRGCWKFLFRISFFLSSKFLK